MCADSQRLARPFVVCTASPTSLARPFVVVCTASPTSLARPFVVVYTVSHTLARTLVAVCSQSLLARTLVCSHSLSS